MASDKLHQAMDLKEAASLKFPDPFTAHMAAGGVDEMVELDREVEALVSSPRPEKDKLERLLVMQSSLGKHAHVQCTPEDGLWREQMEEAVQSLDQRA